MSFRLSVGLALFATQVLFSLAHAQVTETATKAQDAAIHDQGATTRLANREFLANRDFPANRDFLVNRDFFANREFRAQRYC